MSKMSYGPLHPLHEEAGASLVEAGDWILAEHFSDPITEHRAARESAALFDLSYAGMIGFHGPDAERFLESSVASEIASLGVGEGSGVFVTNSSGGIIGHPDLHRIDDDRFLMVCSPQRTQALWEALYYRTLGFDVEMHDLGLTHAMFNIQGPRATQILADLVATGDADSLPELREYQSLRTRIAGVDVVLLTITFSGETGYSILALREATVHVWSEVLAQGSRHGIVKAGTTASESLRIEAALPRFGREVTSVMTLRDVWPADEFVLKGTDFTGKDASAEHEARIEIVALQSEGPVDDPATGTISIGKVEIGQTTSISNSPTLGHAIALGHVEPGMGRPELLVDVEVGDQTVPFRIVRPPFYSSSKGAGDGASAEPGA